MAPRSRRVISRITSSPTRWPYRSLICLKWTVVHAGGGEAVAGELEEAPPVVYPGQRVRRSQVPDLVEQTGVLVGDHALPGKYAGNLDVGLGVGVRGRRSDQHERDHPGLAGQRHADPGPYPRQHLRQRSRLPTALRSACPLTAATANASPSVRIRHAASDGTIRATAASSRPSTSSGSSVWLICDIAERSVSARSRCWRAACTASSSRAAWTVSSDTATWLMIATRMSTSSPVKMPRATRLSRYTTPSSRPLSCSGATMMLRRPCAAALCDPSAR